MNTLDVVGVGVVVVVVGGGGGGGDVVGVVVVELLMTIQTSLQVKCF